MTQSYSRRKFTGSATLATLSSDLIGKAIAIDQASETTSTGKRVGIICLDTSHCVAFTKVLNHATAGPEYCGYKVTAVYPQGSKEKKKSVDRIPGYTADLKKLDVERVSSPDELLNQ